VTGKDRPPGCDSWGPEDDSPGAASVACIVTDLRRRREAALRLPPLPDGRRDPLDAAAPRFGSPSTYSLPARDLGRHIRQLRRQGWQSWEVRVRFGFGTATDAA
jgi:hypothetical protein